MRKRVACLPILLGVVLLGLTACSHRTGDVTIGIVYSGGPNPVALAHRWQPGRVRVFRADGSFVVSGHLREGESLSTHLPPGTYRVVGHSGDARCVPESVTVSSGGSVLVRVVCSVK